MENTLIILMVITALILLAGMVVMAMGGEVNRKYSNRIMTLRVAAQGLALVILLIAFLLR